MLHDLQMLKDRHVKSLLQGIHEYLAQMSTAATLADIKSLISSDDPPQDRRNSPMTYGLVIHTILLFLSPARKARSPDTFHRALVWQAGRYLLQRPLDLIEALRHLEFRLLDPDRYARSLLHLRNALADP
jgi:hypothetical protein